MNHFFPFLQFLKPRIFFLCLQKGSKMKRFLSIIIVCVLVACTASKHQAPDLHSFPRLSYQQMLEDHDTLVSYITQASPIIFYNKEVRGIDFGQHAARLRNKINERTTTAEFLQIVEKTLNAAQDGHTSRLGIATLDIMKKYWIPSGFVKDIDSASTENSYKYAKYLSNASYTRLDLNLIYAAGDYYNLLPFAYKGKSYPASMQLTSCNDKEIHNYVDGLTELVSPLRWDRTNNRVYEETFYSHVENYKKGRLKLVFLDKENKTHELHVAKNDTITLLQQKNWNYGYNSDKDTLITHYFEKQGIFYAKLPSMVEELGDSIRQRLETVIHKDKVNAVVIDIRGNGGGSDNTYSTFLKKIIQDTLRQDIIVGRNFSAYNKKYFNINRDSVINRKSHTFKVDVPTLKEPRMYYIKQSYDFVVPDSIRYPFDGKIYVLQDRYIYSSASNLSSLAKNSGQLTSIGQTPDLLGGLQTDPIVMMLPNSKFIFRVEPQIDLTDIKAVEAIFQNNVEYPVPYPIDHLYLRSTTKDPVYGKEFLLNEDPLFKKVLELERRN